MPASGLNTRFIAAAHAAAGRKDPYQAHRFLIEIEGLIAGGFSECGGLQVETETFEYREGGVNEYTHRFAGPTKYPPLILKHGLTDMTELWEWHQDVVNRRIKRKNGTIYLLDQAGVPAVWWVFKEAYPVKWSGPELRADTAGVAFESLELAHRGLSRPTVDQGIAAGFSGFPNIF